MGGSSGPRGTFSAPEASAVPSGLFKPRWMEIGGGSSQSRCPLRGLWGVGAASFSPTTVDAFSLVYRCGTRLLFPVLLIGLPEPDGRQQHPVKASNFQQLGKFHAALVNPSKGQGNPVSTRQNSFSVLPVPLSSREEPIWFSHSSSVFSFLLPSGRWLLRLLLLLQWLLQLRLSLQVSVIRLPSIHYRCKQRGGRRRRGPGAKPDKWGKTGLKPSAATGEKETETE